MDKGQSGQNFQDPFAGSITPGSGSMPETVNSATGNLNTGEFDDQNHDYTGIGNAALNSPEKFTATQPGDIELTMPPDGTTQLGEVVELVPNHQSIDSSASPNDEALDPSVVKHLADGKINKDDVGYLNSKTESLVNDPVALAAFVTKARKTITGRISGEGK